MVGCGMPVDRGDGIGEGELGTSLATLYALGRREELTRYCDDGRLEIDNLPVERAARRRHRTAELLSLVQSQVVSEQPRRPDHRVLHVRPYEPSVDGIDRCV